MSAGLEAFGARVGPGGAEVSSFGDPVGEAEALRGRAGLLPRPSRATWEASGSQALDYLHRVLTQDLRSLTPGHARYACALTREGRILGDPVVWHLGDRLLLDLAPRAASAAIPFLERYVIADDVVFADRSDAFARLVLCGPEAPEAVRDATGAEPPEPGRFARLSLGGGEALVLRRDVGDRPSFDCVVERPRFESAFAALAKVADVTPVGEEAWDVLRVEAGLPAFGAELDERVLPNEAGLESALSWTKGCYVGQEPVVMARHRGHPASLLCRVKVEAPAPARDTELLLDGRRAGRVTTAVPDPALPGSLALAYVRWDSAREGARLSLPDGSPATVTSVLVAR
jgi:folate-binding protein YgfZ